MKSKVVINFFPKVNTNIGSTFVSVGALILEETSS